MPIKNMKGDCPYCEFDAFDPAQAINDRPDREVQFCTGCDKYSVYKKANGVQYPLVDPSDPESSPSIRTV